MIQVIFKYKNDTNLIPVNTNAVNQIAIISLIARLFFLSAMFRSGLQIAMYRSSVTTVMNPNDAKYHGRVLRTYETHPNTVLTGNAITTGEFNPNSNIQIPEQTRKQTSHAARFTKYTLRALWC